MTNNGADYFCGDGRHRLAAAKLAGIRELRCNVITSHGEALRVIPVEQIAEDPDVQFGFAFSARRAREIATNWSERRVHVLTVWPARDSGLTVAEKADIKLGLDRERRRVELIESLLTADLHGEEEAVAIRSIVEAAGFKVGKPSKTGPKTTIGAIAALQAIYRLLGGDGLRRTLQLNTHWKGEASTNTAYWLHALALLIRDGYDEAITPRTLERWANVVPSIELRAARGQAANHSGSSERLSSEVSYLTACSLRKKGGLRRRPVVRRPGDTKSKPL